MTFDPNAAANPESGIFGLNDTPDSARVVLVPVPFEATTSYGGGTSEGPAAILRASRQVDLWDLETGKPYEAGIAMLPEPAFPAPRSREPADVNPISRQVNGWVHDTCAHWLAREKIVGTVGGDHSISFGAIAAHAEKYPGMGVLHFDAHADLRHEYEGFEHSHSSIMDNVVRGTKIERLVQVGIRDLCEEEHERIASSGGRIRTFYDAELAQARFERETWGQQCGRIIAELPKLVYVSFDIDGLDPALCPYTGTKVPGGLSFQMATSLLAAVVRSGRKLVGFDLTEVAPAQDGSEWDENVGARDTLQADRVGAEVRAVTLEWFWCSALASAPSPPMPTWTGGSPSPGKVETLDRTAAVDAQVAGIDVQCEIGH